MTLSAGSRLGPYEVLSPIGAGGMGEVYRARDTRLSREVALKVLPADLADDRERLSRFEQEARSASALNHPNIVAVYDVGRSGETSFIAMELVEGRTVRDLLASGQLAWKRALSIAAQAADGLAKAHAAGIVHRDLKPENLMVSSDGFVKILDFGLAKLVDEKKSNLSEALTMAGPQTASGVILGTVGYMSPEQASGAPLDFRSDQFSLGAILYEMATGKRAFSRATVVDTLSAILHEEPEPVAALRPDSPVALRWVLDRCLAKEPDERYASTRDLARDLATLRDHLSESGVSKPVAVRPGKRRGLPFVAGLIAAAAAGSLVTFALLKTSLERKPPPSYRQITFRQGTIRSARFSPDGQTVVYSAAWSGQPLEVFAVRPGSPESRSLGRLDANELAVSSTGEMALIVKNKYLGLFPGVGTLARMPFEGGASPREFLERVSFADWSPDGTAMAVVRDSEGIQRLEYPVGKVLHQTGGWISHPRISPDGLRVAFLEHWLTGDDRAKVIIVDRAGQKMTGATTWSTAWGVAWPPDGKEVWFTAIRTGAQRELRALSLSGAERLVARSPAMLTLYDISRDGRVLLAHDTLRFGIIGLAPGATRETELSWLDIPVIGDISADGRKILFEEVGEGGGEGYSIYVRGTDGSPAVRLGSGHLPRFSPDGKWVVAGDLHTGQLILLPTGPGEPATVTRDKLEHDSAEFLPDGKRIVFAAGEPGKGRRLYVQPTSGGAPVLLSPGGVQIQGPVSPDGRYVAAMSAEWKPVLCQTSPGALLAPIPGTTFAEGPIKWSSDSKWLYVKTGLVPARVFRVDPFSGKRELWKEFAPSDPTGVVDVQGVVMTPDASAYAYNYVRILSDLFVAEGLR
ncbi:MAG TPA: protein kinase [Thermoanaerobaculia bacterium]|nr:protein kinase [Thermoanaerobaculia bacterium]